VFSMASTSRETVKRLIADLVATSDLAQLTAKSVRKHVRDELGDGAGEDSTLKLLVRELIDEVLSDMPSRTTSGTDVATDKQQAPAAVIDAAQGRPVVASSGKPHLRHEDERHTNHETSLGEEGGTVPHSNPAEEGPSTGRTSDAGACKRKRKVLVDDEWSEDASDKHADMDEVKNRKDRKDEARVEQDVVDIEDGKEKYLGASAKKHDRSVERTTEKSRKHAMKPQQAKSAKKRAKPASKVGIDAKLQRILRIARDLGCPVPPSRLRCDASEKEDVCNDYLKSKGVGNVLIMDKREIKSLRRKLEHEKELAGLDAGNILNVDPIAGGRRPRRAAAPPSLKEDHSRFAGMSDDEEVEPESEEENVSESDFEDGQGRHDTDSGEE
jgi:hypothetical protein